MGRRATVGAPRIRFCMSPTSRMSFSPVRHHVRDNQESFLQDKDPTDESKGKLLALTGDGSMFEALFARSDVCTKPIPNALHITDYMISFRWQLCNGERAASHINLAKTKERAHGASR